MPYVVSRMEIQANQLTPGEPETGTTVSDRDTPERQGVSKTLPHASESVYGPRSLLNGLYLALGDIVALIISISLAVAVRYYFAGEILDLKWALYIFATWSIGAWFANLYPGWGLGVVEELRRTTMVLCIVYASLAVLLLVSLNAKDTSRLTFFLSAVAAIPLLPLVRSRVKMFLIRQGFWGVPCAIYGAGITGLHVLDVLRMERGLGFIPHCILDDNDDFHGIKLNGVRVIGGTDVICPNTPVAILAITNLTRERLIELLDGPLSRYRKVIVIPNMLDAPSVWVESRDMGGILGLELSNNLLKPAAQSAKRFMDFLLTTVSAPLWAPLTLLLAGLVWLEDRENPFYSQERIGLGGRVFHTWKLRTMVPNAEEVLRQSLDGDEQLRNEWEMYRKLRNDPRITSMGKFLRRFSLDEIPQLYNILKGEMSLVGPRPLPGYHQSELSDRIGELRTRVRPGVTGLWQVSGRSDTGNEGFERYDGYYVKNWSIWLDVVILVRTIKAVFWGRGAY